MKSRNFVGTALVAALLVSGSLAWSQMNAAKPGAKKQSPAAAQEEKKADEPEPKVVGTPIARPGGGWLGLTIDNGGFRLNFYDDKKKPVEVDVARASARWNPSQKAGQTTVILLPAPDGKALFSGRFVQPPRVFKVYLTLMRGEGEVAESHVVDFRE